MSGFDWLVVIVMAVVGWLLVSFLLNRAKPQNRPDEGTGSEGARSAGAADADFSTVARLPAPDSTPPIRTPSLAPLDIDERADLLSLEEIGRTWSAILGVSPDASGAQIEAAYHAKLAECDRIRFDSNASPSNRRAAEQQRARVNQAYEFIRPSRA